MTVKSKMGIEVHVQLNTKSKLFCGCPTDSRNKEPNQNTCPICLGFPGAKPKVNKKAIDFGIMVAAALNCKIQPEMFFSRKSYFYPDMSKNFQISQYEIPLAVNGYLEITNKKIKIRRIHIEEDPAKLNHVGGDITSAKYVLVDYNRAGMPLLEIVTEPDFESPKEVREFLEKLSSILEHLEVYDSNSDASLRVDANISMDGGERIEIKNITGFRDTERALTHEIVRQRGMLRIGVKVERETRHFDAERRITKSLRKKEGEEDYGYIFEPDLTEIIISNDWIDELKKSMPELPDHRVKRLIKDFGIDEYQAKVIVFTDKHLADFFEGCCKLYKNYKELAKWTITYLLKSLNWHEISIRESKAEPETFTELLQMIDKGTITERLAKEIIKDYIDTGKPPKQIIQERGLSDFKKVDLNDIIKKVIQDNQKAVAEYKSGKERALEYLIGNVLEKTKKTADPKDIRKKILDGFKNGIY